MNAIRLYDIANQLQELEELSLDGDIPPEVLRDTIEGLEGTFDDKAIQVARYILSLEATAEACSEAAKHMKARAERVQRRADSIRAYLLYNLQAVDRKRIQCAEFIIARRLNPVAVQLSDLASLPAKFWYQAPPPDPRPDKKAIKEALQLGENVPGAYLEAGERLNIQS